MYKKFLFAAAAAALLLAPSGPASAQTVANPTATVTVQGGDLTIVSTGSLAFPVVALDGTDKPAVAATAAPSFTLNDATGTGAGWNVTVASSNFTHTTRTDDGSTIQASGFKYQPSGGTITRLSGQAVTNPGGPSEVGGSALALNSAQKVVTAAANFGRGRYTWSPAAGSFTLLVPADALAGSYSSTMTFTISSGP